MEKVIIKLPSKKVLSEFKRVAAYARVSTGKDAMLHSMSAQVSYYSNLIQSHKGWQYAGVYADEAQTGTSDGRNDFKRLISDCRAGKIDMVITKSISRFARNTVTLLETVRELKALDVDVNFEEQNIHTMSADGELMLTILASYAQEESLSASENQKWRVRKSFEKGEIMNLRFMFGYHISRGKIEIDKNTTPIVREIFARVIDGESFGSIYRDLNGRGIKCIHGGKWCVKRIRDIVCNEKYTGNALLQKYYRNNHLEKKKFQNTGELPMYYAEGTHPAIIDVATFEAAQLIIQKRTDAAQHKPRPKRSEFTSLIYCPRCGKNYKRVTSNGSAGWNCSTFVSLGKSACRGKKIPETTLKAICSDVLGIKDYDPAALTGEIYRIEVPKDNVLRFLFKDGKTVERTWEDYSRRESWTAEMRQVAADQARRKKQWQAQ